MTDSWVRTNVLPQLKGVKATHTSYDDFLKAVGDCWMENKTDATMLVHMGFVVEAYLFRELVRVGAIGVWDAPYTYIELAERLEVAGFSPDSCDCYIAKYDIEKPVCEGGTHNSTYDALVALKVYKHLQKNK